MEEEGEASPRAPDEYGGDIDGNRKQGHRLPSRGGDDRLVGAQPLRKTDVDQSQLALRSARSTPRFMIDPRYSKFSQYWDLVTMFALLFTAIVTPYEVSFLEAPSSWPMAAGSTGNANGTSTTERSSSTELCRLRENVYQ